MSLFALGNILLKMKRARLPRNVRASWPAVVTGLFSVLVALAGNILLSPEDLHVFGAYFLVAIGVVGIMFSRVQILKGILASTGHTIRKAETRNKHFSEYITAEC